MCGDRLIPTTVKVNRGGHRVPTYLDPQINPAGDAQVNPAESALTDISMDPRNPVSQCPTEPSAQFCAERVDEWAHSARRGAYEHDLTTDIAYLATAGAAGTC